MNKNSKYLIIIIVISVFISIAIYKNFVSNDERLIEAVKTEKVFEIKKLIQKGANPNLLVNWEGKLINQSDMKTQYLSDAIEYQSLLGYACIKKNISLVKELIENGADVNFKGGKGSTPLFVSIIKENEVSIEIIDYLLKNNADINIKVKDMYLFDIVAFQTAEELTLFKDKDKYKSESNIEFGNRLIKALHESTAPELEKWLKISALLLAKDQNIKCETEECLKGRDYILLLIISLRLWPKSENYNGWIEALKY